MFLCCSHQNATCSCAAAIRMPHVPVLQPSECHMFLCCSHQNATCSCAAAMRMPHVPVLQPSECHMFLCCSHQNATCSCAAAIRMPHVPVLQPSVAKQRTAAAVLVRKNSPAMQNSRFRKMVMNQQKKIKCPPTNKKSNKPSIIYTKETSTKGREMKQTLPLLISVFCKKGFAGGS